MSWLVLNLQVISKNVHNFIQHLTLSLSFSHHMFSLTRKFNTISNWITFQGIVRTESNRKQQSLWLWKLLKFVAVTLLVIAVADVYITGSYEGKLIKLWCQHKFVLIGCVNSLLILQKLNSIFPLFVLQNSFFVKKIVYFHLHFDVFSYCDVFYDNLFVQWLIWKHF